MKYLKERFGKYFELKNTINGKDYLLRRTFGGLIFIIPLSILFGILYYLSTVLDSSNLTIVTILGIVILLLELLVVVLGFWFVFATTYNEKHFFIVNIAVGGTYSGSPSCGSPFPQQLMIDYIRVYNL